MDYEMNEVRYNDIDEHGYDDATIQNSQISQERVIQSSAKDEGRWIIYKRIAVVVITACVSAVAGYYVGNVLMTKGYEINTSIRIDRSSLYTYWYISKDNLMISNVPTAGTTRSSGIGFKKYRGAMADRCVEPYEVMTFGVQYDFHITKTLTGHNLLFEIDLAELDKIDKYNYVGHSKVGGFSFNVYKVVNYTGLIAKISTNIDMIYPDFSNIAKGTAKKKKHCFFLSIDAVTLFQFLTTITFYTPLIMLNPSYPSVRYLVYLTPTKLKQNFA